MRNEDITTKYVPTDLPVDDSFALLMALYRSRVYEQYQAQFVADSSEESDDANATAC